MMYRGLNVTWLVEVVYAATIFALGFIAGRFL